MAASRYAMISIPEAQATVLAHSAPLPPQVVPLGAALGRTLALPVVAPDNLPPFRASIKDGYAVVAADGPGEYDVVGESRAGAVDELDMGPGRVAYVTTGAPVPPGADAVIQVEDTASAEPGPGGQRRVRLNMQAVAGQDIRPVGCDVAEGQVVLEAGVHIGVAEVGILATVGAAEVTVYGTPHVAVLSTGDEVVDPCSGVPPGPGQIRDANRAMLLAAVAECGGCRVTDLGIARDTEGHLVGCFERALADSVDVLVTSGGVSMGDRDLIKPLLERSGKVHFGRVLMKPGKPLTYATLEAPPRALGCAPRRVSVFALPGNPVSSFACFHLVVAPALRAMRGAADPEPRRVLVALAQPLALDPERPEYHRATLHFGQPPSGCPCVPGDAAQQQRWWAVSTGGQASSRLLSARSANALLELPRAAGTLPAGAEVSALLIGDLRDMPVPHPVPATSVP